MVSFLVALLGTCGKNPWRKNLIEFLVSAGIPLQHIFDPTGGVWDDAARDREDRVKATAPILLYCIADPMDGKVTTISLLDVVLAIIALHDDPNATVSIDVTGLLGGHEVKAMQKIWRDLESRFGPRITEQGGTFHLCGGKENLVEISLYSIVELVIACFEKPDRVIGVIDVTGMTPEAQAIMAEITAILSRRFPQLLLFSNLHQCQEALMKKVKTV